MRISSHDERRLFCRAAQAYGMCEGDAETVAEAVTLSDMTGVYSHWTVNVHGVFEAAQGAGR